MKNLSAVIRRGVLIGAFCLTLALLGCSDAESPDAGSKDDPTAQVSSQMPDVAKDGAYLAAAANCVSCHTAEGGAKFAGGRAFDTPFGTLYSSNITPDVATGIGSWNDQDFLNAMQRGIRKDGAHLYPAFPYTAYTKISPEDALRILAFLKSQTPVKFKPPENDLSFPYNLRFLVGAWKKLYFREGRLAPDASRSGEWNRGAYLVEGLGHCSACHTERNFLGAEKEENRFGGGIFIDSHPDGYPRRWTAINITPSKSGIGSWSADEIVDYLKHGRNTRAAVYGPMNDVFANSTRYLSDDDLQAMAVYLRALPKVEHQPVPPPDEKSMRRASTTYDIYCGLCHLVDGKGSSRTAPPLAGSAVVRAKDPSTLINTILFGPHLVDPPPPLTWESKMPGFDEKLSDEQVADLATYVRASWGNSAPAVTVAQVVEQR